MKPISRLTAYIVFFGLLIISCDKNDNEQDDFRDIYIGKYQVHERIISYGGPECGEPYNYEKDTLISVTYGNTDTTLIVLGREVWLDSNGEYDDYHYGLRLWNDSLYSFFMNGGLACGQNEIHAGYRISNEP